MAHNTEPSLGAFPAHIGQANIIAHQVVLSQQGDERENAALLNRESFETLLEARLLIERWREHYNTVRSHSALGYRPPAPETIAAGPPSAPLRAVLQRLAQAPGLSYTLDRKMG